MKSARLIRVGLQSSVLNQLRRARRDHRWGAYHRPHSYVMRHWGRGDRLPRSYCGSTCVIHDYYDYSLRRPPYGYH